MSGMRTKNWGFGFSVHTSESPSVVDPAGQGKRSVGLYFSFGPWVWTKVWLLGAEPVRVGW